MEASNGSSFLPLFVILGWLGLKISWFPIHVQETDLATNVGVWQIALEIISEQEESLCVARSLSVPIMFLVVRKMFVQGRAASVTFACRRDVWHGLKISCSTFTSTVTSGVMGRTAAWMAGLMNNGNIFHFEILSVVSVAEIPLVV